MENAKDFRKCKRCLIREMGDVPIAATIKEYIEKLPANIKTGDELYEKRLKLCSECDFLLAGTCQKCGCYVEIRAAAKNTSCPLTKPRW